MVMQGNPIAELSEEKRENRKLRKIIGKQNTQLIQKDTRIKALEGAIDWVEENSPWPKEVWTMTEAEYVEATPDTQLRTAISGYLMRRGWELAVEYIRKQLEEV